MSIKNIYLFISAITGKELEVESLQYTEEKAIDDGRSIIFDILAIDKDGHKDDPIIQKAVSKIYQISEIDEVQLKVIEEALEESKRLDWQDDIIEKARQEAQEKIQEKVQEIQAELQEKLQQEAQEKIQQEKINFARSLLDVLDDKTIADKTGLDMDFVKSLRIK